MGGDIDVHEKAASARKNTSDFDPRRQEDLVTKVSAPPHCQVVRPTTSLKMDPKAKALTRYINEGRADIHGIGVDVCKDVPVHDIIPTKMYQFCEAITADIFQGAGIKKHEAAECFDAINERIHNGRLLRDSTLERYGGMNFLRHLALKVTTLQAKTGKTVCAPAHAMGSMIAAIAYRKLRPTSEEFFRQNEDLAKVFGELNGIQWLPVAIQVWAKVKGRAFAIELDENSPKPIARVRKLNGKSLWGVTTRMPDMNRYEDIFRKTFYPAIPESGPAVPKLEPNDDPLQSIEPNDTSNEPITLSDDDEMEDNAITLRDYTRQMKSIGKRLATPDRAIVKRLRREILKNPDQPQAKEQHLDVEELLRSSLENNIKHAVKEAIADVRQTQEHFDTYSRYKDVWKICLRHHGGISESLRELVKHHCTPSQVFHLAELEKEHLAEMEMEAEV
ncbi:hypothetical protein IWW34DRAFT_872022 [Fusarium oxysporum f. sp. albedinis]|nr:hypothetical protein IWW34DRAFT_872022 [Fusarium oxysporum f. sp. albedinis]